MTADRVRKVVDRFQTWYEMSFLNPGGKKLRPVLSEWFEERAKDQAYLAAARRRLIEYGTAEEQVKRFSPLQVVFLSEKRRFAEVRDDADKGMLLPYWQLEASIANGTVKFPNIPNFPVPLGPEEWPFARLLGATLKVRQVQTRLEQRFALLRSVEALRLYAAEHDGKLPAQLADVRLPLPVDSFTGQAFHYRLDGNTAILQGKPPHGLEKRESYNLRYEITITK